MLRILMLLNLLNTILSIPIVSPYQGLPTAYDDNGCCISCGYEYCDTLLECVRPWETECPKFINPFIITDKNIDDRY